MTTFEQYKGFFKEKFTQYWEKMPYCGEAMACLDMAQELEQITSVPAEKQLQLAKKRAIARSKKNWNIAEGLFLLAEMEAKSRTACAQ